MHTPLVNEIFRKTNLVETVHKPLILQTNNYMMHTYVSIADLYLTVSTHQSRIQIMKYIPPTSLTCYQLSRRSCKITYGISKEKKGVLTEQRNAWKEGFVGGRRWPTLGEIHRRPCAVSAPPPAAAAVPPTAVGPPLT
jgi:hypothetical protein